MDDNPVFQPQTISEYVRYHMREAPMGKKLAVLVWFLLLLTALVASGSNMIDRWIVILVWSGFLLASIILIVKNARHPESQGFYSGQLAALPPSWRRWILGEEAPPKSSGGHSADARTGKK